MKITSYDFGRGDLFLGANVTPSVTVKLGSKEKLTNGSVDIFFRFNDGAQTVHFSQSEYASGKTIEPSGCYMWHIGSVTIPTGGSKTFSLTKATIQGASSITAITPGSNYDNGDYCDKISELTWFSGDNGVSRKYPLALEVITIDANTSLRASYKAAAYLFLEHETPTLIRPLDNSVFYMDMGSPILNPDPGFSSNISKTLYKYPESAMTSASSSGCVASCSTRYSSDYPVWRCFDKSISTHAWASDPEDKSPYVQIQLPRALYDISLVITNRNDRSDNIRGPISGSIMGSNDGASFIQICTFARKNADAGIPGKSFEVSCGNSLSAYKYVKIAMDDWYPSGSSHTYCAIGEIEITGSAESSVITPYEYFGQFIQNESIPRLNFGYELDKLFTSDYDLNNVTFDLVVKHNNIEVATHIYTDGTVIVLSPDYDVVRTYDSRPGVFILDSITTPGTYTWTCTVRDSFGSKSTLSETFSVLAYHRPTISTFSTSRYEIIEDDSGNEIIVESEAGIRVWLGITASVSGISGGKRVNNTSAVLRYERDDYGDAYSTSMNSVFGKTETGAMSANIIAGSTAGNSLKVLQSRTFLSAYGYGFTLTITDVFTTVTKPASIDRADSDFNIEDFGVAVGMMSTGSSNNKLFEVAPTHRSRFYGGVEPFGTYFKELGFDASAPFVERTDNPLVPCIRCFGPVVELHGEMQPNKTITGSDSYYPICKIPDAYAPDHDVSILQQGTGQAVWLLRIFALDSQKRDVNGELCAGKACFARYRQSTSSFSSASTTAWLPFHATWIVCGNTSGNIGGGGNEGEDDVPSIVGCSTLMDSAGIALRNINGEYLMVINDN